MKNKIEEIKKTIWCVPPMDVHKDVIKLWKKYGGDYQSYLQFLMEKIFEEASKK